MPRTWFLSMKYYSNYTSPSSYSHGGVSIWRRQVISQVPVWNLTEIMCRIKWLCSLETWRYLEFGPKANFDSNFSMKNTSHKLICKAKWRQCLERQQHGTSTSTCLWWVAVSLQKQRSSDSTKITSWLNGPRQKGSLWTYKKARRCSKRSLTQQRYGLTEWFWTTRSSRVFEPIVICLLAGQQKEGVWWDEQNKLWWSVCLTIRFRRTVGIWCSNCHRSCVTMDFDHGYDTSLKLIPLHLIVLYHKRAMFKTKSLQMIYLRWPSSSYSQMLAYMISLCRDDALSSQMHDGWLHVNQQSRTRRKSQTERLSD